MNTPRLRYQARIILNTALFMKCLGRASRPAGTAVGGGGGWHDDTTTTAHDGRSTGRLGEKICSPSPGDELLSGDELISLRPAACVRIPVSRL